MRVWTGSVIRTVAATVTSVALLLSQVGPAFAAEDAGVEALIQQGIELRRDGADDRALAVFLEAESRDPTSVRVLLHIVTAAQGAGKWLMADSYMRKVSALSDDPYYRRHADAIDVVRRAIAARIGTFQVDGGPDGATVRLDGELVGTLPMVQPAAIESGTYLMEVHRPGYYRLRRNVVISGGVLTREPVTLNKAVVRSDTGGVAAADSTTSGSSGIDGREGHAWWKSPAVGWSLVGLGVASGVVSGVAFVTRERRVERWNDEGECTPNNGRSRQSNCGPLKDDAETAESIGIAAGITGVILTGVGITQLLTIGGDDAPRGAPEQSAAGFKLTRCDAGMLSLSCQGSF